MMIASPNPDVLAAPLAGETVLLHLGTKRYFRLNRTGAVVWRSLEQKLDAAAIAGALVAEFDVSELDAAAAVQALLAELAKQGLLAASSEGAE